MGTDPTKKDTNNEGGGGDIELASTGGNQIGGGIFNKKKKKEYPRKKRISDAEKIYESYKPVLLKYKDRRGRYNNWFLLCGMTKTDALVYIAYAAFSMMCVISIWYWSLENYLLHQKTHGYSWIWVGFGLTLNGGFVVGILISGRERRCDKILVKHVDEELNFFTEMKPDV